jgi:hypothetical protein
MNKTEIYKYRGLTYHFFLHYLIRYKIFKKFWRKCYCSQEVHLFDEVLSGGNPWEHYLVCDCCQLMVYIDRIDDKYMKE